jgi:hypothetical protein
MLLLAVVLAVSLIVVLLAVSCLAMARDWKEAHEELNQRIEQFYHVALSIKEADGERARAVHRRAQPLRHLLQEAADDAA